MSSKAQAPTGRVTLVIAANANEYTKWLRENGKSRRDTQYVNCKEMLYGWGAVDVEILTIPLWWSEEDQEKLTEIMEYSR